ncbi:MAG: tetratricopeptide repeat protein [Thermodesulfobacteriota bacterium]
MAGLLVVVTLVAGTWGKAGGELPASGTLGPEKLWAQATAALEEQDPDSAVRHWLTLYQRYPATPLAPEALWRAASLSHQRTEQGLATDWAPVRELMRTFVVDYPDSPHAPAAYYAIARANYEMGLTRDALAYFTLVVRKFPSDPITAHSLWWRARVLLAVHRMDEAREAYQELSRSDDPTQAALGQAGLGHLAFAEADYAGAISRYEQVLASQPGLYRQDQDILRGLGLAHARTGNGRHARKLLFHALNLEDRPAVAAEILSTLGELALADGDVAGSRGLFSRAAAIGPPDSRVVAASRVRLALLQDDPALAGAGSDPFFRRDDSAEGDLVYDTFLATYQSDPLAQAARYGLMHRYARRHDSDGALDMGRAFLRHGAASPEQAAAAVRIIGEVLVARMEAMLAAKDFQGVHDLYQAEREHIHAYPEGRLLFLAGQACQALTLYGLASDLYFEALALPLSDADLTDLYLRRAEVYLATGELEAARILLTYLPEVYQGRPELAEIFRLSGILEERAGTADRALRYYDLAANAPAAPREQAAMVAGHVGLLLSTGALPEARQALDQYRQEGALDEAAVRDWYGRLAGALFAAANWAAARDAYQVALAAPGPEDETAAGMQLRLGDALVKLDERPEARRLFEKVANGPPSLWQKLARVRLGSLDIDETLATMGPQLRGRR